MTRSIIIFICLSIFISACANDDPVIPPQEVPASVKGVYIVNEGGFGKSTSSLSFYIPDSAKVYPDLFYSANGRALGDIANDLVLHDNKAYIVVNNSHKIEIISTETHVSLGTIQLPGSSPYKVAIYNSEKAYVTNYYKGSVTLFNPTTYQVVKEITVGKNPKGIAIHGRKAYVCNSGDFSADSTVSVIDIASDVVTDTIVVGYGPNDVEIDGDGDVLVQCYGYADWSNPLNDIPGRISVINSETNSIVHAIEFSLSEVGHPGMMSVSKKGYGCIVTAEKILQFDTKNYIVSPAGLGMANAYAIAIDDVNDRLYVSDAKNFVQNGIVYIYDKQYILLDSISVGIVPGTIVFKK